MTHLRLLTWPVDFDPNCKFIATYLGFARKPFVIQYVTTSSVSVSGELPVIVSPMGTEVACGWEQCLEWLSLHVRTFALDCVRTCNRVTIFRIISSPHSLQPTNAMK